MRHQAGHSRVQVGRRYLDNGFIDVAMKLFVANATIVQKRDWKLLVERLMERRRIADVVRICDLGKVPLTREEILAIGDATLRRNDLDGAICLYEIADADRERWSTVVDRLTARPEHVRRAVSITQRWLAQDEPVIEQRAAAAS